MLSTLVFVLALASASAASTAEEVPLQTCDANGGGVCSSRSERSRYDTIVKATSSKASLNMRADDRCPDADDGTLLPGSSDDTILSKEEYHQALKKLNISALYDDIAAFMKKSQACWPADGPQDGDVASYAGLFGRLAWHCSGSFRHHAPGTLKAAGGCEGARQRFWPENQWRDNSNLDKARGLLAQVKSKYKELISWGDLFTFAGTVGIKASGGPAKKFCFGRVDAPDGQSSVELGVEGVNLAESKSLSTDYPCKTYFRWPEQDEKDNFRCNFTQEDGREQASHSVGLIYVFPEGPQLKTTSPEYKSSLVHNRSPKLSALEVRDTFNVRMGWTDRETVALTGGGHTLGRTHGNCNLTGSKWASYAGVGPYFEAVTGSGRGPTDGTCGLGAEAGLGPNTVTSGFEGPWTRTPSKWNYDYFDAMFAEAWEPSKSPFGNDQWWTTDRSSKYAHTMRLTSDVAFITDPVYREIALEYSKDHARFDSDFADAWYKLMHRSGEHPGADDLEKEVGMCTYFEFLDNK